MNYTILAVFDSGVFRPLEPVDLAQGTRAEVIPLSQTSNLVEGTATWPSDYFEQTAGALAGEQFDRPSQGDLPQQESW